MCLCFFSFLTGGSPAPRRVCGKVFFVSAQAPARPESRSKEWRSFMAWPQVVWEGQVREKEGRERGM